MYRYSANMNQGIENQRNRKIIRILLFASVLLAVPVVVLSYFMITGGDPGLNLRNEISGRISSDLSNAITYLNRMDRTATSKTMSDIGRVRQYIYSMEQMNRLCISVCGERIIEDEVFTALYNDLDRFDSLTQGAKSSTMDAQALLLTHLTNLQTLLSQ